MSLFEHYRSIDAAFTLASAGTGLAALVVAFLCSTAITLMHEFAHLAAARCFGLRGRLDKEFASAACIVRNALL
ncbi:hypothetical protein [Paraburkholderia youngii]|uniref:hypothetical protein n=1 Tax=Paraburkholderia youngii TaxID=2782701 RepID=UPI003D205580